MYHTIECIVGQLGIRFLRDEALRLLGHEGCDIRDREALC